MSFQPFQYRGLCLKINWDLKALVPETHDGDSTWLLLDEGQYNYRNANCRLYGINTPGPNCSSPAC